MASLKKEFEEFNDAVSKRNKLLLSLQEFINEVDKAIREARASCESEEIRKLAQKFSQVSAAKTDIDNACNSAKAYASHLYEFFYIGREDETREKIENELQKGNANPMNDFYDKICKHLMMSQEKYSTFKLDCAAASKSSGTAACKCKVEGNKLNADKKIGGTIGGIGAAAGIGAGITFSIIAGVFTFGTGTLVGLVTTAAVTTTAGIATGVGTIIYAVDCTKGEKKLNEISKILESLSDKADSLKMEVSKVHQISKKLKDIAHKNFKMELKINIVNTVHVNLKAASEEVESMTHFSKFYS